MNYLQFLSSVIGSVAWPTATVAIVLVFRTQLRFLLSQVRKIGGAGLNVELAGQVQEVQRAGEAVELEQGSPAIAAESPFDPTRAQFIQSFPELAVLHEYRSVETILLQIQEILPDAKPHRTLNEVLNELAGQGLVSDTVVTLFQSVRQARNTAVHAKPDYKLTPGEAIELIGQIRTLQAVLARVFQQLKSTR